jgi:hypothetical protein
MAARVVHCKQSTYDVYIGRGPGSIWGNPFQIGRDGTRDEVIAKHRAWLLAQPRLMARVGELHDKTLGCWCKTRARPDTPCHGDTLAEFAAAAAVGARPPLATAEPKERP